MNIEHFKQLPLMGIVRGIQPRAIEPLIETAISAGLKTLEITMNTSDAPTLIQRAIAQSSNQLTIGAGTVLTLTQLQQALSAGATFIVLPTFIPDVVEYCLKRNVPVFPGAFSPNEIYRAYQAGATMVKVFPVKFFGPAYIKEIKGPFADIQLLACGGINAGNIREFFSSGASAVAFGGSIFKQTRIKEGNFSRIKDELKALVAAYRLVAEEKQ